MPAESKKFRPRCMHQPIGTGHEKCLKKQTTLILGCQIRNWNLPVFHSIIQQHLVKDLKSGIHNKIKGGK